MERCGKRMQPSCAQAASLIFSRWRTRNCRGRVACDAGTGRDPRLPFCAAFPHWHCVRPLEPTATEPTWPPGPGPAPRLQSGGGDLRWRIDGAPLWRARRFAVSCTERSSRCVGTARDVRTSKPSISHSRRRLRSPAAGAKEFPLASLPLCSACSLKRISATSDSIR
jgi:hypothetical protein